MDMSINFPNLGIHLEHVGKSISIFGFEIAYYGIIIGIGMIAGVLIAAAEAKRTKQNSEDYFDLAIFAIVFAIIGARLYYVIFSWENYKDDLLSIFNIREGGLAIYGGIIAAVITVIVFAKIRQLSAWKLMDTACLGLIAGQMIGRWGNFFNREAFGDYTNNVFAMQLPVDAVRASDITEKMQEHIRLIDGVSYIQVHPTFLYESLWCLGVLIFLNFYKRYKKFDGEVFFMYLFGYGLGRVWIEGLRTDQLCIPGIGWPVSQVLAGVLVVAAPVVIYLGRRRAGKVHRRF
ncbi:prolipoprotein diacylglyceryl transferase [Lachnoclostridium sp. An181]|uniref:prolipoprotein diacylglyceryl transferase n=1 Tax=Lachnoclostridium sp. An181 TaxID=1965575 RepID=UPI000B397730|nr:prolipoprotein diacylglyceryl transferase [Lachnoclostridium sp. An181]OUP48693.1 prolipoprotein diacylglyceryl transferase [Lachnoclostridium sp. An181]